MKKIVIILPAIEFDSQKHHSADVLEGVSTGGKSVKVLQSTLVNNLQTVEGLRTCLGHTATIIILFQTNRVNLLRIIKDAIRLRKRVKSEGIDLVHQFWGGVASLINAQFVPCKFCISLLGSDLFGEYDKDLSITMKGRILSISSILTARVAAAVVVMSEKMKERLPASIHRKCVIIPEGIDPKRFEPIELSEARALLNLSIEKDYILFFDNSNQVKNAVFAKEVISRLKRSRPQLESIIIGGAYTVNNTNLKYYYSAADLLLITSLHEGSNNSLKEALACNCPIVSSNTGDAELRMKTVSPGIVVDSWDVENYFAACNQILAGKLRSNGREHIGDVTIETVSERMASYYNVLLDGK